MVKINPVIQQLLFSFPLCITKLEFIKLRWYSLSWYFHVSEATYSNYTMNFMKRCYAFLFSAILI